MRDKLEIDKRRKRFLFTLITAIFLLISPVLIFMNFLEQDRVEIYIDIFVAVILISGFVAIKTVDIDVIVYRMSHVLICSTLLYSAYIGAGKETVLFWIFMMPPLFFYFFGKREGLVWALIFYSVLLVIMLFPWMFSGYEYGHYMIPRFLIPSLLIIIISFGLESSRATFRRLLDEKNRKLLEEKKQLEKALKRIKTLSGLIPICSNCKKIRNDKGYWVQVETYVHKHSGANFSHSICPECGEKLYPEYHEKIDISDKN